MVNAQWFPVNVSLRFVGLFAVVGPSIILVPVRSFIFKLEISRLTWRAYR